MALTRNRVIGLILLGSVPLWWRGLHAWAASQYGYLDVDVTGPSPFLWLAVILAAGAALAADVVRRVSGPVRSLALAAFLIVALILAAGNLIAGAGDGISSAGMLLGALSLAQVVLVITGFVLRPAKTRTGRPAS